MNHVEYYGILVARDTVIKVIPHRHLTGQLLVVMEKQAIESGVIIKRTGTMEEKQRERERMKQQFIK